MALAEMPAGRELDAMIAEKVMGVPPSLWVAEEVHHWSPTAPPTVSRIGDERPLAECQVLCAKLNKRDGRSFGPVPIVARFSTDIAAAWEVVEKMGGVVSLKRLTRDGRTEWYANFGGSEWWAEAAPLAICRAALAAVGAA